MTIDTKSNDYEQRIFDCVVDAAALGHEDIYRSYLTELITIASEDTVNECDAAAHEAYFESAPF